MDAYFEWFVHARALAPAARSEAQDGTVAKVQLNQDNRGIALLGDAASPDPATRPMTIHPDICHVHVTGGEIVEFTVGGRPSSFDLNVVAPNPRCINPRR
ncbi:MAG: hypothetical protein H7274_16845 [Rhodoferax sp.]|nr:hypothetical protein [Rhodoferax sp.]